MKIIRWFVDTFAIGGLVITSFLSVIVLLVLTLSIFFNFSPYFIGQGGGGFGIGGYEKGGIPIDVNISTEIPDTSIFIRYKNGTSLSYRNYKYSSDYPAQNLIIYSDTIISKYMFSNEPTNQLNILGATIEKGKIYFRPSSVSQKLILNIPMILKCAILSYCCWQLAMLLSFINAGKSFQSNNYKRLSKTGWSIVVLYLSLFIYSIVFNYTNHIWIDFSSTVENYRAPFKLDLQENIRLEYSWLLSGCMLVILSLAFEKGNKLQQEQDLTV